MWLWRSLRTIFQRTETQSKENRKDENTEPKAKIKSFSFVQCKQCLYLGTGNNAKTCAIIIIIMIIIIWYSGSERVGTCCVLHIFRNGNQTSVRYIYKRAISSELKSDQCSRLVLVHHATLHTIKIKKKGKRNTNKSAKRKRCGIKKRNKS